MTADACGIVARSRLDDGGVVSPQVLNEFVRVSRKKLRLDWAIIEAALVEFRALVDEVRPVALSTHEFAVSLAKRERFDIYDALILAAANRSGAAKRFIARIFSMGDGSANARSSIRLSQVLAIDSVVAKVWNFDRWVAAQRPSPLAALSQGRGGSLFAFDLRPQP
jgi:hypothetical protein